MLLFYYIYRRNTLFLVLMVPIRETPPSIDYPQTMAI